jgi:hypothetical protein
LFADLISWGGENQRVHYSPILGYENRRKRASGVLNPGDTRDGGHGMASTEADASESVYSASTAALLLAVYCAGVKATWGGPGEIFWNAYKESLLVLNRASHDVHMVVMSRSPGRFCLDGYDGSIDKCDRCVCLIDRWTDCICIGRSLQLKDPCGRQFTQTRRVRTAGSSGEAIALDQCIRS